MIARTREQFDVGRHYVIIRRDVKSSYIKCPIFIVREVTYEEFRDYNAQEGLHNSPHFGGAYYYEILMD